MKCCKNNSLQLDLLCSCCGKIDNLESHKLVADNICSQAIQVKDFAAENSTMDNLCVPNRVTASQSWADSANFNSLCASNANIQNLSVANLQVGGSNSSSSAPCISYRATANYRSNMNYKLGSLFNFDNIVDDPNNNVSLSPNFQYVAPLAGYYMVTFKVNASNLVSSSGAVLGVPMANPQLFVNGMLVRDLFSPFLPFFSQQKVVLDSLLTLQAGDVVSLKYNVLAGNGSPVSGSVDFVGTSGEDSNSLFKIILLSGLCQPGAQAQAKAQALQQIPPCPQVIVACSSVLTPCLPLDVLACPNQPGLPNPLPCDSCQ